MENSNIEWTTHTWNPWIGCTKVDELCAHCYAEARDIRFNGGEHWGKGAPRQRTSVSNWNEPRRWNRGEDIAMVGHADFVANRRPRVFCASLSDWLDDEVPIAWLVDALKVISECNNLDWLLLTKRPENWAPRIEECLKTIEASDDWSTDDNHPLLALRNWLADWFVLRKAPKNVWVGTSVGTQKSADTRMPQLLAIPARIRFLSCEPLLGRVDITSAASTRAFREGMFNWVIAGGESGQGARPMHPDWVRYLRDQCTAADIPFFFKQWGEWAPAMSDGTIVSVALAQPSDRKNPAWHEFRETHLQPRQLMAHIGKKAAGRELDGVKWDEIPETH